jgi:hypothetical protein
MTDDKTITMLREANPVSTEELEGTLGADDRSAARERAIRLAGQGDFDEADRQPRRGIIRRGSGPRALVRPAAVVLCVGLAAVLVLIGLGNGGGGSTPGGGPHPPLAQPPFADAAIRWAKVSPRLLVTESGWYIQTISENGDGSGEIQWTNGIHGAEGGLDYLEISWFPAAQYEDVLSNISDESDPPIETTVLGRKAKVFHSGPTADYQALVPPDGDFVVELRGDVGSEDGYFQLLQTLEPTSVNGWLSAMPASVLETADRSNAVDSMTRDIPLPPGMNTSELQGLVAQRLKGQKLVSRYNLGAAVTGIVSCDWLDRWTAGLAKGDQAEVQQAKGALATSRGWRILDQMDKHGDYPEGIWDFAKDRLGSSGFGRNTTHNYNSTLGCNQ